MPDSVSGWNPENGKYVVLAVDDNGALMLSSDGAPIPVSLGVSPLPVAVNGTPSVSISGTPNVGISGTPNVAITNTPKVNALNYSTVSSGRASNANLTANQRYNSSVVDSGTDPLSYPTRIRPAVRYQAGLTPGLLILEESLDGATWLETRRQAIPSDGLYHTFDWPLHLRYWRIGFQNGATSTTVFDLLFNTARGDGSSIDTRGILTFPLTTTALTASATFSSSSIDLGGNHTWSTVRAMVRADQASANAGFRVQWSDDAANWDDDWTTAATLTASGVLTIESKVQARSFRVVYTNAATANTVFRLRATLVSL